MNQKEQIIAELLENESFLKWLSGKGNATDNQFWQNWISENTLHEEAFREISETWSVLTFKPIFSDETDAEWQKLSNRLNLGNGASPAPQQPETYLQRRMNREIHSTRWWLGAGSAVAAVFCMVTLIWIGFFSGDGSNPMNREVRTGNGEQVRIQLPDQSTVLLNANSALHFSDEWTTGSAVNVVLTGEAFFDISKIPPELRAVLPCKLRTVRCAFWGRVLWCTNAAMAHPFRWKTVGLRLLHKMITTIRRQQQS